MQGDTMAEQREQRDRRICELYAGGQTLNAVAAQCGITRERVRQVLKANGVDRRPVGGVVAPRPVHLDDMAAMYATGASLAKVGARYGRSGSAVSCVFAKYGIPRRKRGASHKAWRPSDDEVHAMRTQYEAGATLLQVAVASGRSVTAIRRLFVRLGISRRARGVRSSS